jgi:hypothetical protein
MTDALGEAAGWLPSQAAWEKGDYPIVNRFVRTGPEAGNRIQTDFYDLKKEISQIGNSIKDAAKHGEQETIIHLLQSHPEYSQGLERGLQRFGAALAKERNATTQFLKNPGYTAEAKRKALDDFYRARDKQLDVIVPLLRQAEGLPPRPTP